MEELTAKITQGVKRRWVHWSNNQRTIQLAAAVKANAPAASGKPVLFFNASTRLEGMSLNASFALISSWAVRLSGVPVAHIVCQSGLSRCHLGTDRDNAATPPPCSACQAQSAAVYAHAETYPLRFSADAELEKAIHDLDIPALSQFEWQSMPLGQLCLPSLRWILRRHNLKDDEGTSHLLRQYLLSAWNTARRVDEVLEKLQPQKMVVFNGQSYPEAAARWVARQKGIPVVTHEVGLQPYSVYYTYGDATAYPISIPEEWDLSAEQNARLDAYLEQRMQGNFSMAGIRFWPHMQPLSQDFLDRAASFRQIVPIFTNVIFDTSQSHANTIFSDMFAWLDKVLEIIRAHPETYFVIRAHPDEKRSGKECLEPVSDWAMNRAVRELPNVLFVDSNEYFSSYELIQRSKFVMVYNSTIGMEAAIMGAPVLCAGKARFTQVPTVFLPASAEAFQQQAEDFLSSERVVAPDEFRRNARRFLYYQLYRVSLPFNDFIEEDGIWRGFVRIKDLKWQAFQPQASTSLGIIANGILSETPFLLPE